MISLLSILGAYFAIGALLIVLINRKRDRIQRKQSWIKYLMYLLIVFVTLFSTWIHPDVFISLASLIVLIGFCELFRVLKSKKISFRILILMSYLLVASGFILFAFLKQDLITYAYFLILVFDGFSQLSGQLAGKTKLAKNLSPNKTVEGLAGGFFVTITSAYYLRDIAFLSELNALILGFYLIAMALCGDLLASWIKRKCGVKDYSELIPGHGGILDRFDSFIFAGAMLELLFLIFPAIF